MFRDFLIETRMRKESIAVMLKSSKPADGLLGTTLQWEDVEEIAGSKLGDVRKIKPLAEGVGLQSMLGVAEVKWEGEDSGKFPNTFALKIGSPIALLQALKEQAMKIPELSPSVSTDISDGFIRFLPPCHNSEIYFYESIRSMGSKLPQVLDYYFGRDIELLKDGSYTKGCIAIQLAEGVNTLSPVEHFSEHQMFQVLDSLARLQTEFLDVSEDHKRRAPHEGLSGLYTTFKDWFLQMNNQLMGRFPDPEIRQLAAEYAAILPEIISANELDQMPAKLGMQKVLVHGDLWSANIMWQGDKLANIIDFQMIHFGLAVTDLARLLNTCLDTEERHSNKNKYLKRYYDSLVANCEEHGKKVPFNYDQLCLTYDLAYPRVSAYLLPALTAIIEKVVTMPDVPEKPIIVMMFLKKVKGIYVDIIETHRQRPTI